jgi:Rieske Fe-S protein
MGGAIAAAAGAALTRFTIGLSFRKELVRWVEVQPEAPPKESKIFSRVVLDYETKDAWLTSRIRKLVYVRRMEGGQILALSAECTHLGCSVAWDDVQKQFKCPCHDGKFDSDGKVISGPPAVPLRRHKVKVENGRLFLSSQSMSPGVEDSETI